MLVGSNCCFAMLFAMQRADMLFFPLPSMCVSVCVLCVYLKRKINKRVYVVYSSICMCT